MMTTATLPVYQKAADVANQTILGVMGTDVTITELQKHAPIRKLGPNGYAFSVNNNGYIIFHPNLKSQMGWLKDPPNIDLLDIEISNEEKEELRVHMVNNETGSMAVEGWILSTDETHVDKGTRQYFYTGIPFSNFSLAIAVPDYHKFYVKSVKAPVSPEAGLDLLTFSNASAILIAAWEYCNDTEPANNRSDNFDQLLQSLLQNSTSCEALFNELIFHANVTQEIVPFWEKLDLASNGIEARFIATNAGMTRVFPESAGDAFNDVKDTWKAGYYKRAFDNENLWLLSAHYNPGVKVTKDNTTEPTVLAAHVVSMGAPENHKAAVAGVRVEHNKLRDLMRKRVPDCDDDEIICYLLDDGGYIMASSEEEGGQKTGQFLGDVDNFLMYYLLQDSIYAVQEMYDYQASCKVIETKVSAGHRSYFVPSVPNMLIEMMTLNWWTTKFAWLYMNFNIYNWWYSGSDYVSNAQATETDTGRNRSCIKLMTQYHFGENLVLKKQQDDGNCTRYMGSAPLPGTNLLLAMAELECSIANYLPRLQSIPEEIKSVDPLLHKHGEEWSCNVTLRYRTKPETCYDQDQREDDTDCGGSFIAAPSLLVLLLVAVAPLLLATRVC